MPLLEMVRPRTFSQTPRQDKHHCCHFSKAQKLSAKPVLSGFSSTSPAGTKDLEIKDLDLSLILYSTSSRPLSHRLIQSEIIPYKMKIVSSPCRREVRIKLCMKSAL